jgi:hypothetical protein
MAKKKQPNPPGDPLTPRKRSKPDWAPAFLQRLSECANIRAACIAVGTSRTAVYHRRNTDEKFAQAMALALEDAVDDLELEARRRAYEGCEKPIFHQGEECGRIKEYSDTLMIFLLKAHRPEKYRERYEVKQTGAVVSLTAADLSDDELARVVKGE